MNRRGASDEFFDLTGSSGLEEYLQVMELAISRIREEMRRREIARLAPLQRETAPALSKKLKNIEGQIKSGAATIQERSRPARRPSGGHRLAALEHLPVVEASNGLIELLRQMAGAWRTDLRCVRPKSARNLDQDLCLVFVLGLDGPTQGLIGVLLEH